MPSTFSAGIARHRRLILGVGVALAVTWAWMRCQMAPTSFGGHALSFLGIALWSAAAVLSGVLFRTSRPAMFTVEPGTPAFRTLPGAYQVCHGLSGAFMAATWPDWPVTAHHHAAWFSSTFDVVTFGPFVILETLWIVLVWRNALDVQLRPDGLVDRSAWGRLIVPWEALAPGYPQVGSPWAGSLVPTYARPELVRRRGLPLGRRWISADTVDPWFLRAAIAYYVAHPQCRAEIGTQAGYDRLRWALTGHPPADPRI